MAIMVSGGAGYIGSHMVLELVRKGYEVIVVDNLEKGHKEAVKEAKLYAGDLRDDTFLNQVFEENKIEAVVHFAAYSLVGESMEEPAKYYENNLVATMKLLNAMRKHDCNKIVFSSTAAVFGEPENIPILESDKKEPTNTYGETKLAMEKMLKWYDKAYGIKSVALRYFNAAGADRTGEIGEDHEPETHLIPIILQVALGKREKIYVFGEDYPTEDGTCLRDYIHVTDLAQAHILALQYLEKGKESNQFNLGNGKGYSVKQVIDMVEKVTGKEIKREIAQRRAGDPAVLVASAEKAKKELGWKPEYDSLETIIETAWNFYQKHPNGYEKKK